MSNKNNIHPASTVSNIKAVIPINRGRNFFEFTVGLVLLPTTFLLHLPPNNLLLPMAKQQMLSKPMMIGIVWTTSSSSGYTAPYPTTYFTPFLNPTRLPTLPGKPLKIFFRTTRVPAPFTCFTNFRILGWTGSQV
ncbi:hypothetical protein HanRHA438_Chr01g0035981 [Helianthus annuus]|nr:hypothetical protein HanRHA438_Chr01g0035981 [Helianthus annuus]